MTRSGDYAQLLKALCITAYSGFLKGVEKARLRRGRQRWPNPERYLLMSGPAGSLRVIFHTVAAQAPTCLKVHSAMVLRFEIPDLRFLEAQCRG